MKKICSLFSLFFLFVFTALLFSSVAGAQNAFKKKYERTFGTHDANKLIETSDGGFVILGIAPDVQSFGIDIYLIRLDSNGDTLWTKTIGGILSENGTDIIQTFDGGYFLAGRTSSFGFGGYDICMIRLDSNGNILWSKVYGSTDADECMALEQSADSGFVLVGRAGNTSTGNLDGCLLKVNSQGDSLWSKIIGEGFEENLHDILRVSDNYYLVAGIQRVSSTSAPLVLFGMNDDGDTLWAKKYDLSGLAYMNNIIKINSNSFLITGSSTQSPSTYNDFCAVNIDSSGNILWAKLYEVQNDDFCFSSVRTSANRYILNGFSSPAQSSDFDLSYLTIDSSGNFLNAGIIPHPNLEMSMSCAHTSQGCFAVAGTELDFSNGSQPVIMLKTDSNLNIPCSYLGTVVNTINIIPQSLSSFFVLGTWGAGSSFIPDTGSGAVYSTVCFLSGQVSIPSNDLFQVYPNPFDGYLDISFIHECDYEISVCDLTGKVLFNTRSSSLNKRISLDGYSGGVYFLSIRTANGLFNKKLMKR